MPEQIPLLEQYERIKSGHRDEILFFRLGDFYEMFYQDALEASSLLNLTLTHRQDAPMCGIPHHAARSYIGRLLRAGRKIAICEQLAPAGKGKGIIERAVVEVITPGSAMDEEFLDSRANNYLAAFGLFGDRYALSWADASTGEFRACSFPSSDAERLRRDLYRLSPRELILRQSVLDVPFVARMLAENPGPVVNRVPDWVFAVEQGGNRLREHFGTVSMKGFGFDDDDPALAAAGAVLEYLGESTGTRLSQFALLVAANDSEHVAIDESSQKNLEIDRNLRDGTGAFTLLDALDYTRSAMGARALRRRFLQPLVSVQSIERRLDAVEALHRDQRALERTRRLLASCLDLERLAARLSMERANARDILGAADTLTAALALDDGLPTEGKAGLAIFGIGEARERAGAFIEQARTAIAPEPSAALDEGGLIRDGWNAELDTLRALKANTHQMLERYLEEERAATGLAGLKVKYNRILGYYLELSRNAAQGAPAHFIRRQSLSNGERYTTERLSALESDINGASERIIDLEYRLFVELRSRFRKDAEFLQSIAGAIAELDCAACLAWAATTRGYVRPVVDDSGLLDVRGGRHPVVEAHLPAGDFVPNDLCLDTMATSFALITGPNMAGKSTFLRQNALIVLMAQAGSFVPAVSARIGV
ncbi:MAG: DNA mismatch repair protein MutS, partial [Spirochaetales bacterium]